MNRGERRRLAREQAKDPNMPPWIYDTVTIGYIHPGNLTEPFVACVDRVRNYDMELRRHRPGVIAKACYSGQLAYARNLVVEEFLNSESDWLWLADDDMGFPEWGLARMLNSAYVDGFKPIIGGLTFAQRAVDLDVDTLAETYELFPVMGDWNRDDTGQITGYRNYETYDKNALIQVEMTGAAMLLIHRSAAEHIGGDWFTPIPTPANAGLKARFFSEDTSFCLRCTEHDLPIWVDTGMPTSHRKNVFLTEQLFDMQRGRLSGSEVEPATAPVAVLVPVMKRPQNAEPFMRSLVASTGLATAYAIYDEDDIETRDAWKLAGAQTIPSSGSSFATKINDGYRATGEPWVFLVGDDVRFHSGWLDQAEHVARTTGAAVVGANDLANARVMRGEHATHMLIARSYIDEYGASWDGPGIVTHEGYGHWFVDDEIVACAKQRGTFTVALASKVEHLHPIVGKAEPDEVYELGQQHAEQDRKVFEARRVKFA